MMNTTLKGSKSTRSGNHATQFKAPKKKSPLLSKEAEEERKRI
jgi:hypothetical protein